MPDTPDTPTLLLDLPVQCPACHIEWEGKTCVRCGMTQSDVRGLLQQGCMAYENARALALSGDFRAACLHLGTVRRCGIAALTEHPAVQQLTELCVNGLVLQAAPLSTDLIEDVTRNAPPKATANTENNPFSSAPAWLLPLLVGGGVLGAVAVFVALLALLLAFVTLVLIVMLFLRR